MSLINLKSIEKTIKDNKQAEITAEKFKAKKEERDALSIKKLPQHSGNFNFKSRYIPMGPPPAMCKPPEERTEYREGLLMVCKDLVTNHCEKFGCDKRILKKELDESKDIKHYADQYISLFDVLPDFLKCGLTVASKVGISKAGIDRFNVVPKEKPIKNIEVAPIENPEQTIQGQPMPMAPIENPEPQNP